MGVCNILYNRYWLDFNNDLLQNKIATMFIWQTVYSWTVSQSSIFDSTSTHQSGMWRSPDYWLSSKGTLEPTRDHASLARSAERVPHSNFDYSKSEIIAHNFVPTS